MSFYRVIEDFYGVLELETFNTLEEAQAFVEQFVKSSSGKWLNKYYWLADDNEKYKIIIYQVER